MAQNNLFGEHGFGVQFIYDGYGTAEITAVDGILNFNGSQYSNDKEEYVILEGTNDIIEPRNFTFRGDLKLLTKDCCGLLDRKVTYTFRN